MGVGVAVLLAVDEIEHHRAGIGCILDEGKDGSIVVAGVMPKGAAATSGIQEGDVIEAVDARRVIRGETTVSLVSDWVRGKEFSVVNLTLRKPDGQYVQLRAVRQRVPGTKTEMLGMLWQGRSRKEFEALGYAGKIEKLEELHRRGNLSREELALAKRRLADNKPVLPTPRAGTTPEDVWNALAEDVSSAGSKIFRMIEDPEVARRRAVEGDARKLLPHPPARPPRA